MSTSDTYWHLKAIRKKHKNLIDTCSPPGQVKTVMTNSVVLEIVWKGQSHAVS